MSFPSVFETWPTVYAVADRYEIIVPVNKPTVMWVTVSGKNYYDDSNGILRSAVLTHKMDVPMPRIFVFLFYFIVISAAESGGIFAESEFAPSDTSSAFSVKSETGRSVLPSKSVPSASLPPIFRVKSASSSHDVLITVAVTVPSFSVTVTKSSE